MNITTYNKLADESSYEVFSNLFQNFYEIKRKSGYATAMEELKKCMPKILHITEGLAYPDYADCSLDTNYQHFYDEIVKLKDSSNKQIYTITTDIVKSDMNLWHKIWKIISAT